MYHLLLLGIVPAHAAVPGCHWPHLAATRGGGRDLTGHDQLTISIPNLGVAEVTDIVRFVNNGKLNIRSEEKVDVVSVLVKVLIPDFRLTFGLIGGWGDIGGCYV